MRGLAKGWALHGLPLFRGSLLVGYSTFYPSSLAPAFRLAADGASALAVAEGHKRGFDGADGGTNVYACSARRTEGLGARGGGLVGDGAVDRVLGPGDDRIAFLPGVCRIRRGSCLDVGTTDGVASGCIAGDAGCARRSRAQGVTVALGTLAAIVRWAHSVRQGSWHASSLRPTLIAFTAVLGWDCREDRRCWRFLRARTTRCLVRSTRSGACSSGRHGTSRCSNCRSEWSPLSRCRSPSGNAASSGNVRSFSQPEQLQRV